MVFNLGQHIVQTMFFFFWQLIYSCNLLLCLLLNGYRLSSSNQSLSQFLHFRNPTLWGNNILSWVLDHLGSFVALSLWCPSNMHALKHYLFELSIRLYVAMILWGHIFLFFSFSDLSRKHLCTLSPTCWKTQSMANNKYEVKHDQ